MVIQISKFGRVLLSRPDGREAHLATRPRLANLKSTEGIELNFSGVDVLTSDWADEFLTPLFAEYPNRVVLLNTHNASVREVLKFLGFMR